MNILQSILEKISNILSLINRLRVRLNGMEQVDEEATFEECVIAVENMNMGIVLPTLIIPATPQDVKKYSQYIDQYGNLQNGEMLTYIAEDTVIDCENTSHTIPEGYHTGEGRVKVVPVEVSANPSEEGTVIYAQSGEVISQVTVLPIPDRYKDVSDTTLTQNYALEGYAFYDSEGVLTAGSMVNRRGTSGQIDGINVKKYTIPHGYHDGSGSVTLTDDIENALKEL